ncbi:MAG TPA: helix-turn-helix transcriptional regulator [Bacteroidia bacterium]|nr:helix-turn-helix transcriptional regulator [Bacteroidia bacterium]
MNIGHALKKIRELKGYTQEDIAEKLGITQSAYSKIELKNADLTIKKLEEIATILGVQLHDVIGFHENLIFNLKNNKKANGLVINQNSPAELKIYYEYIDSLKTENTYLKKTIDKLIKKNNP